MVDKEEKLILVHTFIQGEHKIEWLDIDEYFNSLTKEQLIKLLKDGDIEW